MPGIDRSGDPPNGLYELTAQRTNQRVYNLGTNYWSTTGAHVHGDVEDFLGLALRAKYGPGFADPCGAPVLTYSRFLIGGEVQRSPSSITSASRILIGGQVIPLGDGFIDAGILVGGVILPASPPSAGRFLIGGTATPLTIPVITAGILIGGTSLDHTPSIEGGILFGGELETDDSALLISGVTLPIAVKHVQGAFLIGGTTLPVEPEELATGILFGGELDSDMGGLLIGGTAEFDDSNPITGGFSVGGSSEAAASSGISRIKFHGGLDPQEGDDTPDGGGDGIYDSLLEDNAEHGSVTLYGSGTFHVPEGVWWLLAKMWGGGGGGGGLDIVHGSGGGGAGGFVYRWYAVTPGRDEAYHVGAGGGHGAGAAGGDGEDTWFYVSLFYHARGGKGGDTLGQGVGGLGGDQSDSPFALWRNGGKGGNAGPDNEYRTAGGGGGAGSLSGSGADGFDGDGSLSGEGGAGGPGPDPGGKGGGPTVGLPSDPDAPTVPGGGGRGFGDVSGNYGSEGCQGAIILEW